MNRPFEGFDDEENKDKKLSLIEKGIIKIMIVFFKLVLWKVGKAKTYGDLKLIGDLVNNKFEKMDQQYANDSIPEGEELEIIEQNFKSLD